MLKYAVAGLTSFAYFRRSASEKSALPYGVLYAFSGFSCINVVFYHFHDVIALFPLLMLGLDKRMQEGKKAPFLFAVAINALVNYYFFIGEVFFLVFLLYYAVSFWRRGRTPRADLRKNARKIPACILEGCLGVGMAGSSRRRICSIFSAVVHDNWYSIAAYLPLVGVCLVLAYLLRWKWDWLHVLLVGLFLCSSQPGQQQSVRHVHQRAVPPLVLHAGVPAGAGHHQGAGPSAGLPLACGLRYFGCSHRRYHAVSLYVKRDTIVYRKYWLVVLTLIAIGGVVLLFAALGGVRRLRLRRPMAALTACTALVAALTTGFTVGTYQRAYTQTIGLTTTEIYGDVIHSGDGLRSEQINVSGFPRLPIGFCYNTYMTRSEFDEIDPPAPAPLLLKAACGGRRGQATVSTILRHYDAALDGKISQKNKVMPTWTSAAKPAPMCLIMAQTIFIPKSHPAASSTHFSVFPLTRRGAPRSTANLQRSRTSTA